MSALPNSFPPLPDRPGRKINRTKQAAFLSAYARLATYGEAAKAARISVPTHFYWMDNDPTYPARFRAAQKRAVVVAEDEIVRRGIHGVDKGVYYKGVKVDVERQYSDFLLHKHVQANNPDKWKDRTETTFQLPQSPADLSDEQLAAFTGWLESIAAGQQAKQLPAAEQVVDVSSEPVEAQDTE